MGSVGTYAGDWNDSIQMLVGDHGIDEIKALSQRGKALPAVQSVAQYLDAYHQGHERLRSSCVGNGWYPTSIMRWKRVLIMIRGMN